MKDGSELATATALAHVPFERVRRFLTDEGAAVLLGLDGRGAALTVGAEPARNMVWMRGSYWYQGEYTFTRHPAGTSVTYTIRNVSGHPDLLIRLWQRRVLRAQQRDLEAYAAELHSRLG